jgi:Mg-chelatase subunit ChlD
MTTQSMLKQHIAVALLAALSAGCQGNLGGDEDAEDASGEGTDVLPDSPVDVPVDQDLVDPVSDAEDDGSVPDADDPDVGDPDAVDLEEDGDTPCQPRLFILLDRSASMLDGSPQRWNMVRQSLVHFLESVSAEGIEYGLGAFPTDNICAVDGLVVDPLPEADLESVESFFDATTADGNTPLVGALEFLVTDSTANLDDEAALNALVVITDGWESCMIDCYETCISEPNPITCMTECTEEIDADAPIRLAAAATALRDERGVRTFVIGISEEVKDEQLSAIAGNGGTAGSEWISALTGIAIEDALVDIAGELKECLPIGP